MILRREEALAAEAARNLISGSSNALEALEEKFAIIYDRDPGRAEEMAREAGRKIGLSEAQIRGFLASFEVN